MRNEELIGDDKRNSLVCALNWSINRQVRTPRRPKCGGTENRLSSTKRMDKETERAAQKNKLKGFSTLTSFASPSKIALAVEENKDGKQRSIRSF